jgi:hypothetical protein
MTTEYSDVLDEERLAKMKPYKAVPSRMTRATVEENVNRNFFLAYGPRQSKKGFDVMAVEPLLHYRDLLEDLKAVPGLKFMTGRDTMKAKPEGNDKIAFIRHDVDGDLVGALAQAKLEAELGIKSSYYLLHTAPYHGVFAGGSFQRNEVSVDIYREIQDLGHEIALHTDSLTLFHDGYMGTEGLVTELEFLRSKGLDITGTVSHNSFGVYGANNFSIFKGKPLAVNRPGTPAQVIHNGKWVPLQLLDENELGLEYEANDMFWQEHSQVEYFCLMRQGAWFWQSNLYAQLSEDKEVRGKVQSGWMSQAGVADQLRSKTEPCYALIAVHPMYYALRRDEDSYPMPVTETESRVEKKSGGFGGMFGKKATPREDVGELKFETGEADGRVEYQSVGEVNELGMRSLGKDHFMKGAERWLFIGRRNLAGHSISTDSKIAAVAARMGAVKLKTTVSATTYAHPELDFQSAASELADFIAETSPTRFFIGVSAGDEKDAKKLTALVAALKATGKPVHVLPENAAVGAKDAFDPKADTAYAAALASANNVPLIDIAAAIRSYNGTGKLAWKSANEWAIQAHYLAGEAIANALADS